MNLSSGVLSEPFQSGSWILAKLMVDCFFDDFKSFRSLGTDEFGADRATPWPSPPSRPSSQWTRTRIRFETDKNFFWPVGILCIAKKYRRPVSTTWLCQISFWWCHLGFQFWPSCLVVSCKQVAATYAAPKTETKATQSWNDYPQIPRTTNRWIKQNCSDNLSWMILSRQMLKV